MPRKARQQGKGLTFDSVRQMALALPGVVEGTSYRTPAFRSGGKLIARFHQDGESLVIKVDLAAREVLMAAAPQRYYITDHYRCWPWMLVRLSAADPDELRGLLEEAWRRTAPKRLLAASEAGSRR
jgi:hypothetical protein